MRRIALCALLTLVVAAPADATVARTAQYRSGRAATGSIKSAQGTYDAILLEPSAGDAVGYASGAGVVATPAQPGLFDATKPWLIFTHEKTNGSVACAVMSNITKVATIDELQPGKYLLIDETTTSKQAIVVARVACADGTDTELTVVWFKARNADPPMQLADTFPFSGGSGDPHGNALIHGILHDSYFWICGDVSGCVDPVARDYWRLYDANLTIAR